MLPVLRGSQPLKGKSAASKRKGAKHVRMIRAMWTILALAGTVFVMWMVFFGSVMFNSEAALVQRLEQRLAQSESALVDHLLQETGVGSSFEEALQKDPQARGGTYNMTHLHNKLTAQDDALVREVVHRRHTRYWLESKPTWPKDPLPPSDRYVTFSPWRGGFNNIRMSLEMAAAFALATNRTLVMPPGYAMYLRGQSSLVSYFDYEDLRRGLSVVTYEEFYDRVDFGRFQKEKPGTVNHHGGAERYYSGLGSMPGVYNTKRMWPSNAIGGQIVYCVPDCPQSQDTHQDRQEYRWFQQFSAKLKRFSVSDPALADAQVVHFPENLLGHFYTMVYFRDPQQGRRVKRIIRDHIHFREEIIELAERIISKLGDFQYSCLHIRRNEFQFKDAWTPAETIVENTKRLFKPGERMYISTDELSDEKERKRKWSDPKAMVTVAKHTWFEPMKEAWGRKNVLFLSDFYDDLLGPLVPDMWLGCIESVVCSRARVFVGTRKSTFSGYIHRLRGYMLDVGQKLILEAQSVYPYDYFDYFRGPEWNNLKGAYGGGHPYWGREYKESWEWVHDPLG
ncbi:GDP-fucose protein O-fucosyltransferase 1 [Hondaea fermentalgiana]|uniref:GDP-fucose protein O-fucosyltransferase 1 n=1 Tax=Hondaea fermentalgiana TaxID=2315210 RepID=A0A2R5GTX2_9STRA|nr:GDP-fucose protein O-fucosyltransferase 1 [Hondaea fermentalgiana]|eukprot:GBG32093.1 GDP-fucose protein O-fucosyltransferase 1 [Hondaea fermentalgiana]